MCEFRDDVGVTCVVKRMHVVVILIWFVSHRCTRRTLHRALRALQPRSERTRVRLPLHESGFRGVRSFSRRYQSPLRQGGPNLRVEHPSRGVAIGFGVTSALQNSAKRGILVSRALCHVLRDFARRLRGKRALAPRNLGDPGFGVSGSRSGCELMSLIATAPGIHRGY